MPFSHSASAPPQVTLNSKTNKQKTQTKQKPKTKQQQQQRRFYIHLVTQLLWLLPEDDTPESLVASRAYVHRFNGTVGNNDIALNSTSLHSSVQRQQTETLISRLPLKEIYWLILSEGPASNQPTGRC